MHVVNLVYSKTECSIYQWQCSRSHTFLNEGIGSLFFRTGSSNHKFVDRVIKEKQGHLLQPLNSRVIRCGVDLVSLAKCATRTLVMLEPCSKCMAPVHGTGTSLHLTACCDSAKNPPSGILVSLPPGHLPKGLILLGYLCFFFPLLEPSLSGQKLGVQLIFHVPNSLWLSGP